MQVTIDKDEVLDIITKGVQDRYGGDAMTVTDVKLVVNSPRGETRYVTATGELKVRPKVVNDDPELAQRFG